MTEKHIGCPDGSTIVISHRGENIVISIEDTNASLSLQGAQRLVDHFNTIVPTRPKVKESRPIPQDNSPSPVPTRETPCDCETQWDLLAEDLNEEETELLTSVRWKLRARQFPIKGPPNKLSDIEKDQRVIVTGWVDHALKLHWHPGTYNEQNAYSYLRERQAAKKFPYKERTLQSYLRYLQKWSKWCKSNNW